MQRCVRLVVAFYLCLLAIAIGWAYFLPAQVIISHREGWEWLLAAGIAPLPAVTLLLGLWGGLSGHVYWVRISLSWVLATISTATIICLLGAVGRGRAMEIVFAFLGLWLGPLVIASLLRAAPWPRWRLINRDSPVQYTASFMDLLWIQAAVLIAAIMLGSVLPLKSNYAGGLPANWHRDLSVYLPIVVVASLAAAAAWFFLWTVMSRSSWPRYFLPLLAVALAVTSLVEVTHPPGAVYSFQAGLWFVTLCGGTLWILKWSGYRFVDRQAPNTHTATSLTATRLTVSTLLLVMGVFAAIKWLGLSERQQVFYAAKGVEQAKHPPDRGAIVELELRDVDARVGGSLHRFPDLRRVWIVGDFTDHQVDLTRCQKLTDVVLDAPIDGTLFENMQDLPALSNVLVLGSKELNASGLKAIAGLPQLEQLSLFATNTNDELLRFVASHRRLAKLDLEDTMVSDDGLLMITSLPELKRLDVEETNISAAGVLRFLAARRTHGLPLPDVLHEDLALWKGTLTPRADEHVLQITAEHVRGIELIRLNDVAITDRAAIHLAHLSSCPGVSVVGTGISDKGLNDLLQSDIPFLRIRKRTFTDLSMFERARPKYLDLEETNITVSEAVQLIGQLQQNPKRNLTVRDSGWDTKLVLTFGKVAVEFDDALSEQMQMEILNQLNVTQLTLRHMGMTDELLEAIENCSSLELLTLRYVDVDPEQLDALQRASFELKIEN